MSRIQKILTITTGAILAIFLTVVPLMSNDVMAKERDTETYYEWCGERTTGTDDDAGVTRLECVIMEIFNWFSAGVVIVVIVGILIGAVQYSTASGAQDKAKKGIETIRNACIALVLYLIMWALLNFLVPGGVFDSSGDIHPIGRDDTGGTHYVA